MVRTHSTVIGFSLKDNFDDVLSVLTRSSKGCGQIVQHCWFNILFIPAPLKRNEEVMGENNDVEPTMLSNLTTQSGSLFLFRIFRAQTAADFFAS